MGEPVFQIGAVQNKDGVTAVADALVRLMTCGAEQKTIREDINAFGNLAETKNVSLDRINVDMRTFNGSAAPAEAPSLAQDDE